MLDQAVQANSAARPARAKTLLNRVLRAIGTGPVEDELALLRGRAKITLALALFEGGGQDAAFALLTEAEQTATGTGTAVVQTLARIQRSGLHGRRGNWAEALEAMLEIGDAADEVSPRASTVVALNSGLARQLLGDFAGSATDLERARSLAVDHAQPDLAAAATHNLGRLAFCQGEVTQALALMERAREMSDVVSHTQADVDQARVLLDVGLLDAAALLLTAETEARSAGLSHDVGEITMERARLALLLGEYPAARVQARTASRSFSRRHEQAWRTQADLLQIEAELAGSTGTARRRAVARHAIELDDGPAAASGVGTTATLLAAEALALRGEVAAAARRLAAVRASAALSFPDRLHLHLVRATVAVAQGDTGRTSRHLRAAVTALATEQGRYAGLDTRTAVALHGRRLQTLDLTQAIASGSPRRVFVASERWRGVSYRLPRVSPTDDPVLNDLLAQLRQARAELRDAAAGADRTAVMVRVTRLERTVQRRDWETAEADGGRDRRVQARPVGFGRVQAALEGPGGPGGLVSFFVHENRLRAVTVEPGRARLHDLADADEVTERTRRLAADLVALGRVSEPRLRAVVERSTASAVAVLSGLLAPALPDQGRLTVLPSRLLSSLPWRLLPQLAGRAITVAPSSTFWHRESNAVPRGSGSVVCVAGPQLRRAEEEVEAVAALTPSARVLSGAGATGAALTEALRDARVVHVAAHGSHHEQSPLFSSILLVDGPLFAHEFQRVGVGAEHVVLSSCDVGRARVRPGEEGLGLTSALLACGVRTVVAAVAPVRDEVAATVMTAYHREVLAGADAALALERASLGIPDARLFCTYGADWSLHREAGPVHPYGG